MRPGIKKAVAIVALLLVARLTFGKNLGGGAVPITLVDGEYLRRGCDSGGCGYFGAPRTDHTHQGLDILCVPNNPVYSPFDGKINRIVTPYWNDSRFSGLEIALPGTDIIIKIMYMNPLAGIVGQTVSAGQFLGTCQNISIKYGPSVPPHLHCEVHVNAVPVDPAPYLFGSV